MTPLEIIVWATIFGIAVIGCLYLLHQFQVHRWRTRKRELHSLPDFEPSETEREREREFTRGLVIIGACILIPFTYLVLLILNIQRAPPLTDWTWAPLAVPLVAGIGYLLYLNVTTGGGLAGIKTPATRHVLLRAGLVSFLVILLFVIFRHAISHVYNVWPSVERNAEQTGIRQLFGEWWDDPWIFYAVPLAIFIAIYGLSKRFTLPEWLWPDKTPVFPAQHGVANPSGAVSTPVAANIPATRAGSTVTRTRMPITIFGFDPLVFLVLLLFWVVLPAMLIVWFYKAEQGEWPSLPELGRQGYHWLWPGTSEPRVPQYNPAPRPIPTTVPPPTPSYAPTIPASLWGTATPEDLNKERESGQNPLGNALRNGYMVNPSYVQIPPGQWWSVDIPDFDVPVYKRKLVTLGNGRFWARGCTTPVNGSCDRLFVRSDSPMLLFFADLP